MKKRIISIIGIVILLLILAISYLWFYNPGAHLSAAIEDPTGFVCARGAGIYDENGDLLQLRGVNLGNWFVPEEYMSVASVDGFDTGRYTLCRGHQAMEANPNLTEEQIEELNRIYLDSYIQEEDFMHIRDLGLNTVRINFTYRDFTDDAGNLYKDAFHYLDWALDMCEKYEIYAVLDQHGAYGSQNQDHHCGDDTQFHLYDSEENKELTKRLWVMMAERYRDRTCVAGYDLLNECRRAPDKFGGKINTDYYHELYEAIREVDDHHMIIIEYFSFPINGVRLSHYDWENICVEYHIYNLTSFSQLNCLRFYNFLNNFMGVKVPVYIGEWSCWELEEDWYDSIEYFNRHGWSHTSWTYKANDYMLDIYKELYGIPHFRPWGVYEVHLEPVNLYTATYEEIREVFEKTQTKFAHPTLIHQMYEKVYMISVTSRGCGGYFCAEKSENY